MKYVLESVEVSIFIARASIRITNARTRTHGSCERACKHADNARTRTHGSCERADVRVWIEMLPREKEISRAIDWQKEDMNEGKKRRNLVRNIDRENFAKVCVRVYVCVCVLS